jgi:hypothetical protein
LPVHHQPLGVGADALLEGTLALSGNCLVVVRGSYDVTLVVWPDRFSLVHGPNGLEVHGNGQILRQGETVRLGGGEWPPKSRQNAATAHTSE